LEDLLPNQIKERDTIETQIGRYQEIPKKIEEVVRLLKDCIPGINTKNIYVEISKMFIIVV